MNLELDDRVFLITGGTDGLGLRLAQTLLDEGAHVALCGRDDERLSRAQELLGPAALCFRADVTVASELDAFIDATMTRFGRLDGAVNNAGKSAATSIAASSDDTWREDFELKVIAALHVSRRVLDALEVTHGSILNVLAIMARTPGSSSTPTAASRAAGLALTKALANEVAPRGIRVNAVLIGLIESGQWVRRAREANLDLAEFYANMARTSKIPLGRLGRAEEFADVAAFLLSARASYLTGAGISIDGGLSPVI
ncbi:MAG: short-chain dehydrogenase/reductase [Acidimicrobiaceae bacterium]|nr:short-chain dehydrogenase/reductase [Acidimicrobiaceae bacterium]